MLIPYTIPAAPKASSLSINRNEHDKRIAEKLKRELGPKVCELILDDQRVIEIMLNPDGKLWVERMGEAMQIIGVIPAAQAHSLMGTVASTLKTHITAENPILECELPKEFKGARFEALIPPVVAGPTFTIRMKAADIFTLENYVTSGIMAVAQCEAIKEAVRSKKNILVVGGTGTGKTTLTNAIIKFISIEFPDDRLAVIEDTGELQVSSENAVVMRTTDLVNMTRLLKATLRLRPDRIVVGEVRDGSAGMALLKAWNTGHPGGVCTVHADSAAEGLLRLELLLGEVALAPMHLHIAKAVNLIISIEKAAGSRYIKEVVNVKGYDGINYMIQLI